MAINQGTARLFHPASDKLLSKGMLLSELGLMRRVFESVVNGVTIADATADDLPLVYVNPAFEKMTGYSSDEVLGRNCRFLQQGKTRPSELAAMHTAFVEQRDVRVVLKNYTKQGVIFWNELYMSPVFDSANRLTHYVGIQNDITSRVQLKRRIEHLALHDGLTGLANRSLAMDRLQQGLDRSRRRGQMTVVMFIDLDDFKAVNDRYGHESGDELLKAVATRLKQSVRGSDCAARFGGDEFVLVASDLSCETETEVMKARVISRIEEPVVLSTASILPHASIGLSIYPRDGDSPQELLRAADLSMYLNKRVKSEQGIFRRDRAISLD